MSVKIGHFCGIGTGRKWADDTPAVTLVKIIEKIPFVVAMCRLIGNRKSEISSMIFFLKSEEVGPISDVTTDSS